MRPFKLFSSRRRSVERGFTLIELLVVMTIIGALTALLLPALLRGKAVSQSIACLNNLKELQVAWHLYADDHNDILPPNGWRVVEWTDGCPQGTPAASGMWVLGDASLDKTDWGIRNGVLF